MHLLTAERDGVVLARVTISGRDGRISTTHMHYMLGTPDGVQRWEKRQELGLFTEDERIEMLREVTKGYDNVRVLSFRGLLVDFCRTHDAAVVVKGLRAVSDFDYELQMAQMNIGLAGVETLFMPTNPLYSFLSSSLVKEVAKWGGDVSAHVPDIVAACLSERLAS